MPSGEMATGPAAVRTHSMIIHGGPQFVRKSEAITARIDFAESQILPFTK